MTMAIVGGVAAVVGIGYSIYSGEQAKGDAKKAAKELGRTAIENIQFLASQGIDAANLLGEGGQETLARLGLQSDGQGGYTYGGGLPDALKAIIDPVLEQTGGAFDFIADSAADPEMGEIGGIQQLVSDRSSKRVLDEFGDQSPAVQKEIMRLADIEGRKSQSGMRPHMGRMADIETGALSDTSNIEARNTSRLASILQNVPSQQANLLLGNAGQAIPYIGAAQEASALGTAAGRVSDNAQLEQLSKLIGSQL